MYEQKAMESETKYPRYIQLAEKIKAFIDEQRLLPGSKLPGGRYFAEQFKAGKNTVYEALEYLQSESVIEIRKDSGTYIAHEAWFDLVSGTQNWKGYLSSCWQRQEHGMLSYLARAASDNSNIYLGLAALHKDFGYQDVFRKALAAICADEGAFSAVNIYDVLGAKSLREELSRRMRKSGIDVKASNIAVTWGITGSIDLLIKGLLSAGDTIYTQHPSSLSSLTLASSIGVNIVTLPSDGEGIDLHELKKHIRKSKRAILIINPDNCSADETVMSISRRKELMELCTSADLPVVEIGKCSNMGPDDIPPLKALDKHNRVIYIDSIILPYSLGIDISWIAAPDYLIDKITDISTQTCHYPFNLNNMAVERMLADGSYDAFISTLAPKIAERMKLTDTLLTKHMTQYAEWSKPPCKGMFWLRMKDCVNTRKMFMGSAAHGVIPIYGDFFDMPDQRVTCVLPFALSDDELAEGIRRFEQLAAASRR